MDNCKKSFECNERERCCFPRNCVIIAPTGPTGQCEYRCRANDQLILNGGMESRSNNQPSNWIFTNPTGI